MIITNLNHVSPLQECPASELSVFPGSSACRLLALSDGTVVQQDVTPVELCQDKHVDNLRRVVAKKFGDGRGTVTAQVTSTGCLKKHSTDLTLILNLWSFFGTPCTINNILAYVSCCYTDGCNENMEMIKMSKSLVTKPMSKAAMEEIIQQVSFINQ